MEIGGHAELADRARDAHNNGQASKATDHYLRAISLGVLAVYRLLEQRLPKTEEEK